MRNRVFVVLSHLEVEPNNFSTEVVKAFDSFYKAHEFAGVLKKQADGNETIEIEEMDLE
jgi:hypothetical protein